MIDDGVTLDATFHLKIAPPREASLVFESCGGKPPRNRDYNRALTLLLRRLGDAHATLVRVDLETAETADRTVEDRLILIDEADYEIVLHGRDDYKQLRIGIGRGAGRCCREGSETSGGNTQRRIRLHLRFPDGSLPSEAALETMLRDPSQSEQPFRYTGATPQGARSIAKDTFVPNLTDMRKRALRDVPTRPGQAAFRAELIKCDGPRCVVSGCEVPEALEAAHISAYLGEDDNHPANGVLLRADLHKLFDASLLGIHPDTFVVHIKPRAAIGEYAQYVGRSLIIKRPERLSKEALRQRWALFVGDDKSASSE